MFRKLILIVMVFMVSPALAKDSSQAASQASKTTLQNSANNSQEPNRLKVSVNMSVVTVTSGKTGERGDCALGQVDKVVVFCNPGGKVRKKPEFEPGIHGPEILNSLQPKPGDQVSRHGNHLLILNDKENRAIDITTTIHEPEKHGSEKSATKTED